MNTPRWYMLNKMGMATLCLSEKDAKKEARAMDMAWPHMGPHRAVQLVEAEDVEALRAGYEAARLEIESLRARSVAHAGEYPALPVPVFESWAQGGLLREAGFTADQMRAYVDADRAMRAAQPDLNLNCKSTQKRLATLWGFVPAQPAPRQEVQEPVAVPRFNCWSTNEGDSWFDHPADSQAIYDCLGNNAKVGDEYELTAGWESVTARYRITGVVGDGEEYEVECISHPRENTAPQPSPTPQADSVLEDAARWQTFIALPYATRTEWASNLSLAPVLTQWVDAARKQGANHD